jgi:putative membrane protein
MKELVLRWFILTVGITIAAYLIDGIQVSGFFSALFTAAILGILNALFRPVLLILTLPINLLTMGLFTFVINAFMLMLASGVISGFQVDGFWPAVFGSLIISAINWISSMLIGGAAGPPSREQGDIIDLNKEEEDKWS